jgi:hypothetical protein
MKKPAKLDNYIVAHLKDHPNEYVQVSFPKFIFYPVGKDLLNHSEMFE